MSIQAHTYFATCAKGLEPALARELRAVEISAQEVREGSSGVYFSGDQATGYRACLWLRTGVRVLQEAARGVTLGPDELYEWACELDWTGWMQLNQTFSVEARVWDSAITHSKYAAMRIKDALCDTFRDQFGARPNVDVEHADLPLFLYLYRDEAVLYRDLSGQSLHKRGYRAALHKANLNECLAAGLLELSGWDGQSPLADPMCGSGTILIEAALKALKRAPGLSRKAFPFERWPDFEKQHWAHLRTQARDTECKRIEAPLYANDRHAGALSLAQRDAEAAGVTPHIKFSTGDAAGFIAPTDLGRVITNPPWGERLDEKDWRDSWKALASCLRGVSWQDGASAWILSGNAEGPRLLREQGLKPAQAIPVRIGQLEARIVKLDPPEVDWERVE